MFGINKNRSTKIIYVPIIPLSKSVLKRLNKLFLILWVQCRKKYFNKCISERVFLKSKLFLLHSKSLSEGLRRERSFKIFSRFSEHKVELLNSFAMFRSTFFYT